MGNRVKCLKYRWFYFLNVTIKKQLFIYLFIFNELKYNTIQKFRVGMMF